jgi:hypothetical protein
VTFSALAPQCRIVPITSYAGERVPSFHVKTRCMSLLVLAAAAVGQSQPYPHNAVNCERCHSVPIRFGGSSMTVQRMGTSFEGRFIPASEGGIHHRNGESTQSSPAANGVTGERVSLSLLGDGYVEAVDSRDIEQNAQQQSQANLGITGVIMSAPVLEASGSSPNTQVGRFGCER